VNNPGLLKDGKRTVFQADPWRFIAEGIALTPFVEGDDLHYEYYFSILGKVLYQIAGKKTALEVRSDDSVVTATRKSLPGAPVHFKIAAANKPLSDLSMLCEVRDRDNRVIQKTERKVVLRKTADVFAPDNRADTGIPDQTRIVGRSKHGNTVCCRSRLSL
jgi:hypothetical protein